MRAWCWCVGEEKGNARCARGASSAFVLAPGRRQQQQQRAKKKEGRKPAAPEEPCGLASPPPPRLGGRAGFPLCPRRRLRPNKPSRPPSASVISGGAGPAPSDIPLAEVPPPGNLSKVGVRRGRWTWEGWTLGLGDVRPSCGLWARGTGARGALLLSGFDHFAKAPSSTRRHRHQSVNDRQPTCSPSTPETPPPRHG